MFLGPQARCDRLRVTRLKDHAILRLATRQAHGRTRLDRTARRVMDPRQGTADVATASLPTAGIRPHLHRMGAAIRRVQAADTQLRLIVRRLLPRTARLAAVGTPPEAVEGDT